MLQSYIGPSISKTAFNCPHCGALAKQFWNDVRLKPLQSDASPNIVDNEFISEINFDDFENQERAVALKRHMLRLAEGAPFTTDENWENTRIELENIWVSRCFNCEKVMIWLRENVLWPNTSGADQPTVDMPPDVRADFEEASSILESSPRGAAALLRLSIQKLCKQLGEEGKNINDDISSLVKKGLDTKIQMALDIVRVVGNNAVHPGQIDLKDDKETAKELFKLVNLITETMITHPKQIEDMYGKLPSAARAAIEARDKNSSGKSE